MSTASNHFQPVSVEEYLRNEPDGGGQRHEYIGGQVFAMANPSERHEAIVANLVAALAAAFRKRCQVYGSNLAVHVEAADAFFYPDVKLVCGKPALLRIETSEALLNPSALFEVLSPSTRNYDQGDKFTAYRSIDSLLEYLTIEQDRIGVTHWAVDSSSGRWVLAGRYTRIDETVSLVSGSALSLDAIYEGIAIPTEEEFKK